MGGIPTIKGRLQKGEMYKGREGSKSTRQNVKTSPKKRSINISTSIGDPGQEVLGRVRRQGIGVEKLSELEL